MGRVFGMRGALATGALVTGAGWDFAAFLAVLVGALADAFLAGALRGLRAPFGLLVESSMRGERSSTLEILAAPGRSVSMLSLGGRRSSWGTILMVWVRSTIS